MFITNENKNFSDKNRKLVEFQYLKFNRFLIFPKRTLIQLAIC